MRISDLIALSFENLRRRMGRTVLTVIGVVVGTCSIVVMLSLGIAMNKNIDEMLSAWGDLTMLTVYNFGYNKDAVALTDASVQEIQSMPHVEFATPIYRSNSIQVAVKAGTNDKYAMDYVQIVGLYPEAMEKLGFNLLSGTYPAANQPLGNGKKIQVLWGEKAAFGFRDTKKRGQNAMRSETDVDSAGNLLGPFVNFNTDPVSLHMTVGGENNRDITYKLQTVGIMETNMSSDSATGYGLVMDLSVLKRLEKEYQKANGIKVDAKKGYEEVRIKVDDMKNVEELEKTFKDKGYDTQSATATRENMQKQSQMLQMILGGLGAVSLFVAALSIANTMTMAIYERTREIGVMKVLGCKLSKIRSMFLFEAAMIGFIGGLIGIVLSYILSVSMNAFAPALSQSGMMNFMPTYGGNYLSVIPPWLAIAGVVFSTLIGVLSGIMPANRAVRISALEAIRHE